MNLFKCHEYGTHTHTRERERVKSRPGFTLIELLVVISIIGFLATASMVMFNSARAKARDARRISDLKQIRTALEMFYDQQGRYPETPGGSYWDVHDPATSHWRYFANCLEKGADCGFTLTNFQSVMLKVPLDPTDDLTTTRVGSGWGEGYFPGWEGRGPQCYILAAWLETNSPALQSDADGDIRTSGDNGCSDPVYCIKNNWPC